MNKIKALWQRLVSLLVKPCADEEITSEFIIVKDFK